MHRRVAAFSTALVLFSSGCAEPENTIILPVFDDAHMSFVANGTNAAVALAGDNEVPARPTRARGTAIFHVSDDVLRVAM
jgi:hypothetical protein